MGDQPICNSSPDKSLHGLIYENIRHIHIPRLHSYNWTCGTNQNQHHIFQLGWFRVDTLEILPWRSWSQWCNLPWVCICTAECSKCNKLIRRFKKLHTIAFLHRAVWWIQLIVVGIERSGSVIFPMNRILWHFSGCVHMGGGAPCHDWYCQCTCHNVFHHWMMLNTFMKISKEKSKPTTLVMVRSNSILWLCLSTQISKLSRNLPCAANFLSCFFDNLIICNAPHDYLIMYPAII